MKNRTFILLFSFFMSCNQGGGGGNSNPSRQPALAACTDAYVERMKNDLEQDGCAAAFSYEDISQASLQEKVDCRDALEREIANPRDKSCTQEITIVEGEEERVEVVSFTQVLREIRDLLQIMIES